MAFVRFGLWALLPLCLFVGCGDSGPTAPSQDELTTYVNENPGEPEVDGGDVGNGDTAGN
ncbi:hypothetical protein Pla52n_57560 [Stieleria varia]|uniref:Secreted protein n=1 Tax=Stieleria varia TaxID=2528005 RepID=A0A5C6A3T7_9BACT|nr:hypothetical protein Pla52n_57560 [Stieleria varia]